MLFPITDGYVSPSSYPSKAEHGEVVPTWNSEVVHVHGTVQIHDNPEWLRAVVTDLTDRHEAARSVESRWAVTDAPGDFIDRQLRAIVGIEVQTESIEGKRKLSHDRSEADRLGAAAALAASPPRRDQAVAEAMGRLLDAPSWTHELPTPRTNRCPDL